MSAAIGENLPLINPRYQPLINFAVGATVAAIAAVLSPWEAVRIVGMTVLIGVSYGIVNDMYACRDCIEYFTVGHFYDGRELRNRPLNTLNPNLNALAWGMIATWHVCTIAGAFFSFLARTSLFGLALKITAAQLAPYLAIGAAIALLVSHNKARSAQKDMEQELVNHPIHYRRYLGGVYRRYEGVLPDEFQAGWHACNTRNLTGYLSIGIGGVALSIAIIAIRAGLFGI